jgi:GTP-binding protein HflX
VIALVGYTNAGKSTLFNRLTDGEVLAEDMLFATLDPTMREVDLPGIEKAILSDTVGFVSDLPTQLVAAFRATLEEVISADLILHVRDISHAASEEQRDDVLKILADLGIDPEAEDTGNRPPMIEIWNKIDLVPAERRAELTEIAARRSDVHMLSAITGEGCDEFVRLVSERILSQNEERDVQLPSSAGAAIAWLHQKGNILKTVTKGEQLTIKASLNAQSWGQFDKQFGELVTHN